MSTYEKLERELRKALAHLYDPDYIPSIVLCDLLGCDPETGIFDIQDAILRAIENLKPPTSTPPSAQIKRLYDVLFNRFVLKLTQEESAYKLNISRSTIQRAQREALHLLTIELWQSRQSQRQVAEGNLSDGSVTTGEYSPDTQEQDWPSQVQRELNSLRHKASENVCIIDDSIADAIEIINRLLQDHNVGIEVRYVQPELTATVHPVILQQILISILKRLAQLSTSRQVDIYARLEDGNVKISLSTTVSEEDVTSTGEIIDDIPASDDIQLEIGINSSQAFVWIEMPSTGKVSVFVVDDNEDMVRFYRSSTVGTRYQITHIADGETLFRTIPDLLPDIIVLDVMLPDIDGWRLLMRLHENPHTRSIPVIICSVVKDGDLAMSLGATRYLQKPVRRQEFVGALDDALSMVD